jgi:SpoVK/Ycf46/Vps4 family AAA+-type ATPase
MARATAGECQARFIPVSITDVLDPYIGVSEQNLKNLFDKARSQKPSIMFFDEVDTIGYSRSKSSSSMRGVIDTFLTEMEGIDTSTDQILVLGATNMPWDVDNALKRPGRFDRMVFVAPPDAEARQQLFNLKLADRYIHHIDCEELAKRTEFFSGADIDNLCERAAELVLGEILETGKERAIGMDDMLTVMSEIRPSTMEWLKTAKNYVKYANQSGIFDDVEQYLKQYGRKI